MLISENKIYFDGSHYIAIPHATRPKQRRKNKPADLPLKDTFDKVYENSQSKPKSERKDSIVSEMRKHFDTDKETIEFVQQQLERRKRNTIVRRTRLSRKVNLQEWNYFCTFTYEDGKHSEDGFRKTLSNCLSHLSNRKGWKYIGVWERGKNSERLHFHALVYIPENAMMGELIKVTDYDTTAHRKQTTLQNTFFNDKFGRSDFKEIDKHMLGSAMSYLVKYIEKSGERLVYSKGLPTYFISDVMEDDVICPFGQEERKLILSDSFNCWDNGEYIGVVSPNVIRLMRKSN